jgi:hypothetical protein
VIKFYGNLLIYGLILTNKNNAGFLADYSNMAEFRAAFNRTASKINQTKYLNMWIPYKRQNAVNLTYTSVYNNKTKLINPDMWGGSTPSPGDECVHCYYDMCTDDSCELQVRTHICNFPAGAPVTKLQGFCSDTLLGKSTLKPILKR